MSNESDDEMRLGHDPLEWLQDDDEEIALEVDSEEAAQASEAKEKQQEVETESEPEPEPETIAADVEHDSEEQDIPDFPEVTSTDEEVAEVDSAQSSSQGEEQSLTFDNHKAHITLPERLVVQIVEPLHNEWKAVFYDIPQSLDVDAAGIKDIDAAGMQLLFVLVDQLSHKGCEVGLINVPQKLQKQFVLAGLDEFFQKFVHAA